MNSVPSSSAPTRTLFVCLVLVALSTVAFPYITGYGMQLFQAVALSAWALVAIATSETFADQHHFIVWPLAGVLNIVMFSVVALPLYFVLRRRIPIATSLVLAAWLLFYVGCLFVLFPATDGP
jgi:hypothetical protein